MSGVVNGRAEGVTLTEARTTATLVLVAIGLWVLSLLARPFTTPLIVLECSMGAAFGALIAVPGLRRFFALDVPGPVVVLTAVGIVAGAALVLEAGWWAVAEWQRDRLAGVGRRAYRLLAFLARRLRPKRALGLSLTVLLALLVAAGTALGAVVQDVIAGDDSARLDRPVLEWFVSHRQPGLTTVARELTWLGSSAVLIPVLVLVGVVWWRRRRRWVPLAVLTGGYAGAVVLHSVVRPLVGRSRPPATFALSHAAGFAFPSGHATQATVAWALVATLAASATTRWGRKVAAWAAAAVVVGVVGATRLYLGVHWLTDVLGGFALGLAWVALLLAAVRTIPALAARPGPRLSAPADRP
jgi:undecaprenyl-diphosphatase